MYMTCVYVHVHVCDMFNCFRSRLTTYKELCSLASDLNQPDLIYKFMHLANHNALWNSKKVSVYHSSAIIHNILCFVIIGCCLWYDYYS